MARTNNSTIIDKLTANLDETAVANVTKLKDTYSLNELRLAFLLKQEEQNSQPKIPKKMEEFILSMPAEIQQTLRDNWVKQNSRTAEAA